MTCVDLAELAPLRPDVLEGKPQLCNAAQITRNRACVGAAQPLRLRAGQVLLRRRMLLLWPPHDAGAESACGKETGEGGSRRRLFCPSFIIH